MKHTLVTLSFLVLGGVCYCMAASGAATVPAAGTGAGRGGGTGGGGSGANGAGAMALNRAFYATEFDILSQQLSLTDDQKAKLQQKIDIMNKELDQFVQGAQPRVAAARRAARGGARGNAGGGVAGAGGGVGGGGGGRGANVLVGNPVVVKLQDDLQLLANQHQVLINQELTPEQRLQWETYKLTRVLDPRLLPLGLTDDQKDKVKALVDDTAKQLAELGDGKTVQELQGKLYRKIVGDVLTDAQVGKLMEGVLAVQQGGAGRGAGRGAGATPPPQTGDIQPAGGGGLPAGGGPPLN